jgi:hypothetical protein
VQLSPRRPKRAPYAHASWGLAATIAPTAFCASYALQRLLSLLLGEPDPMSVAVVGHTPYYWRVALALLHALIAMAIVKIGVNNDRAESVLRFAPMWVPCVVLPLALVLVGLP